MSTSTPRTAIAALTRWTVNVVLVAVTLVAAAYLVPSLLGYERYVITGGSMSGTFEKGSIAFEKPVDVSDLAEGDIVTYLPPPESGVGTLVTHRIVETKRGETGARVFITQGDANPDPDPWKFTLDQGSQPVVQFTVPHVGYALIALADRETRMVVIGVPAAIIALLALVELAGALRRPDADPVLAPVPVTPSPTSVPVAAEPATVDHDARPTRRRRAAARVPAGHGRFETVASTEQKRRTAVADSSVALES